jgi:hypothetical protein
MAVIVPLLLFIFLGLMEVGWAIRGYLILLSTNRETTRYGARGDYLNFDGVNLDPLTVGQAVGYNIVLGHAYEVLANNELGLDLTDTSTNGAFILSHYYIDTGKPCKPNAQGKCLKNNCGGHPCDCRNPADRLADYPYDDLILYPGLAGYDHFIFTQGMSITTSKIDAAALALQLKEENDALNCSILQRSTSGNPVLSNNSIFVVEGFYEQPQLLGVPLLSNTFTDPIGLYNQTKMRISTAKLPQGGGCELFPVALNLDNLNNYAPGQIIPNIRNGPPSDNDQRGWLRWNGTNTSPVVTQSPDSEEYLDLETENMRLSMTDYIEPPGTNPQDTNINVGDRVAGVLGEVSSMEDDIESMIGRTVTVPVWSSYSNGAYTIAKFVKVRLEGVDLTTGVANRFISAVYVGEDPNCSLTEN